MQQRHILATIFLVGTFLLGSIAFTQDFPGVVIPDLQISRVDRLNVFNKAWETVNKHFFAPKFNGVDWAQVKVKYQPLAEAATDKSQLRDVLNRMVAELHVSHVGVTGFSRGVNYNYGLDLTPIEGQWLVRATDGTPTQNVQEWNAVGYSWLRKAIA